MAVLKNRDLGFHGRGIELVTISIVFTVVAVTLVTARVTSRVASGRKLHGDDHVIIISMVS